MTLPNIDGTMTESNAIVEAPTSKSRVENPISRSNIMNSWDVGGEFLRPVLTIRDPTILCTRAAVER
jgi:hypothetical protein